MTYQVANIPIWLTFVEILLIEEWEEEIQLSRIHNRLRETLHCEIVLIERNLVFPAVLGQIFVRYT